jgi:hypothetical protein
MRDSLPFGRAQSIALFAILPFDPVGIGFDLAELLPFLLEPLLRFIFAPENPSLMWIARRFATAKKDHRRERCREIFHN